MNEGADVSSIWDEDITLVPSMASAELLEDSGAVVGSVSVETVAKTVDWPLTS
jgi:hypothetical protein